MAQSTGTIEFSDLPDTNARVVINDGQGDGHSEVTFLMSTTTGGGINNHHLSGTAASNNVFAGNASKAITLYKSLSTSKAFLRLGFYSSGTTFLTNAQVKEMATGGSTPLIYEFRDADGNIVNITLVNESSGFSSDVSGASYSRKDSAGNYSINTNNAGVDGDNIAEEIKDILNAADSAGEIVLSTVTRSSGKAFITISTDATGSENVPVMFRLKRASGSWTSTAVPAAISVWSENTNAGNVMARLFAPDEPIYSFRAAEDGGSGEMDTTTWAAYMAEVINNLPIQITATSSGDTVSLTNDNHGTDGNQTITTTDSTNVSVSGMSGGAAQGGNAVAKRLQISARQIALSGSGGLSGSGDGKSSLMLDLAGLSAASIAQTDVLAFADVGSSNIPKKITFSDFEDAVFGNVSGDATVAAGGALTIANDAIESGMLNDNVISGQTALGGTGVAQADEFLFSDGGTLKKITASNLEDWMFGNISGDASVAAGGALTIAADAVESGMLNDNVISGQTELAADGLAAADELLISDGGTLKKIGVDNLMMDGLGLLSAAAIDVSADHMVFLDGGATGDAKVESLADVATAMAGAGIGVSAGVLSLDIDELSALSSVGSIHQTDDHFLISDGGTEKKITFSDLEDEIFGNFSGDLAVAAGGAVTMAAAQTNITSLLATDIKIGEDDQTKIDFGTVNQISFFANNNEELTITDDGVTIAGNLTVNGSTTTVDTTHLLVEDNLIEIARGSGSGGTRASNAGAGIYITGSVVSRDVSLTVAADGGRIRVSGSNAVGAGFDIDTTGDYAIAGTQVLSADGAVKVQSGVAGAGLGHSAGVLSLDIDELSALGGTGVAQGDHFVFSDGGTEKKITASNLEDWIFGNVSGDATIAAGGALTIAADSVEGSMLNDNVISGQTELAADGLAAADELLISDGGTLKKIGVDNFVMDGLGLLSAAAIDVAADHMVFLDGGATGDAKVESLADVATAMAGAGIGVSSGVLSLDIDELSALGGTGLHQTQDHFVFSDNGTEKKITFSNLQDAVFADVSGDATIAAGGALTIAADAVEPSMINIFDDSLAATDTHFLIADGTDYSSFALSGDVTCTNAGVVTIASDAVESGMLNDNVISGQTELAADGLAAADELLISDGGTLKKIGVDNLMMDGLGLLSAAAVDVSADHIVFLDGGATGDAKVESLSDLVSGMAGAGVQASAGTFSIKSREDRFTGSAVAVSGTVGTLGEDVATTGSVFVFINGMMQSQGYDYSLGGSGNKTLSLKGANSLAAQDEVIVKYIKS